MSSLGVDHAADSDLSNGSVNSAGHGNDVVPHAPLVAISDPNTNLTAAARAKATLDEMDNSPFSKFHLKTILIAGSGFLCDGYDLQVIGMLTNLLGRYVVYMYSTR